MSTEHQKYSIPNQRAFIESFALTHEMEIVGSYVDEGKSGLSLCHRQGLQRLLADAVRPDKSFAAILVFDISRWGRFQDPDQAAHYEFICRDAGAEVIYCAEPFQDCDPVTSRIMKALKRVMAGEYSRELSAKIVRGRLRAAAAGLWVGSSAPYGLRREMFDDNGAIKILETGQQKSLKGFRTRIVHGPEIERDVVRWIFKSYAQSLRSPREISGQLNRERIRSKTGSPWSAQTISGILRNELYLGIQTFNRNSRILQGASVKSPGSRIVRVRVTDPVVPASLFNAAARRRSGPRHRFKAPDLLSGLRDTLKLHGRISYETLAKTSTAASPSCYQRRFGGLEAACAKIGYTLDPHRKGPRRDLDEVLHLLRLHYEERGYVSAATINSDPNLPSSNCISGYFGGLVEAYAKIGAYSSMKEVREASYERTRAAGVPSPRSLRKFTKASILEDMKRVYAANGALTKQIVDSDRSSPSFTTVRQYCGKPSEIRAALAEAD